MEKNYLSVAQVNNYIRQIFESEFLLQNIAVYGEISSYNVSNGIAYFNIKDQNNMLSCVLFGANRFDSPQLGDMVLVTGSVSYYAKGGRLSFNATSIAPYGKGMLYEQFLQLKAKLEKLGYFTDEHKKPIPKRVKTIGVVTSETGAVIRDIIDVATRRNDAINIILFPSKVQGIGAENEIAKGIEYFNKYKNVDCIIVARGGGSLEDLQPFNTEVVANAVFNSALPIVSAVGHETDVTIIDFVSDLRAPTPSAAAELVVHNKMEDYELIEQSVSKILKSINMIASKVSYDFLNEVSKIHSKLQLVHNNQKSEITATTNKMQSLISSIVAKTEKDLEIISLKIKNADSKKIMSRGFVKVEKSGKPVRAVQDLLLNEKIELHFLDGSANANVVDINIKEGA